jgi:hypothetical protein
MTRAIGLRKHDKELQDMGADEATIAPAAKGLARNAISRAGILGSAEERSSNN